MAGLIEMPFGTDSGEPKEPYITWVEIPREGQFRGFQSIEKHWEPLLWRVQQRDHSVLNNGTTYDAAFHQVY